MTRKSKNEFSIYNDSGKKWAHFGNLFIRDDLKEVEYSMCKFTYFDEVAVIKDNKYKEYFIQVFKSNIPTGTTRVKYSSDSTNNEKFEEWVKKKKKIHFFQFNDKCILEKVK